MKVRDTLRIIEAIITAIRDLTYIQKQLPAYYKEINQAIMLLITIRLRLSDSDVDITGIKKED